MLLVTQLNVWTSVCRIMCVQSLTLEGCFHIHLLKGKESFSVLTSILSLRHVPTSLQIMVQYANYIKLSFLCLKNVSFRHVLKHVWRKHLKTFAVWTHVLLHPLVLISQILISKSSVFIDLHHMGNSKCIVHHLTHIFL